MTEPEPTAKWTLCARAQRHLSGNECPHIPTGGKLRSGFGCDACTQNLIDDVERAAVAVEQDRIVKIVEHNLGLFGGVITLAIRAENEAAIRSGEGKHE